MPGAHRGGDLQPVVVRGLVRVQERHRADRRVGPAGQDVRARRRGGRCDHRVVHVTTEREVAVERPDVGRADGQGLADLALNADVRLVGARPLEVLRHTDDAAAGRVRAVIRERGTADEGGVGVAEGRAQRHTGRARPRVDVAEGQACGPRLEVRHRIPLVARDAAVENAPGGADRGSAVAERIPDDTDPGGHVAPAGRNDAAFHAGVAVEQLSDRRVGADGGLLARHVGREPVLRVGAGRLHVPPQPEVQRHRGR